MRAWATAVSTWLLWSCGGPSAAENLGHSVAARETERQAPPPPPQPWPHWKAFQNWPTTDAEPRPSRGHEEGHTIQVRVNPEAAAARYATWTPGATLPNGSLVVAEHWDEHGRPGPIYVMEKTTGWNYRLVDREGLTTDADLPLCQRCHAEAVSDELFGPVRRLVAE